MTKVHPPCDAKHDLESATVASLRLPREVHAVGSKHSSHTLEFTDICSATAAGAGEVKGNNTASVVAISFHREACLLGARETFRFFVVVTLLSVLSFGFTALFFGCYLGLEQFDSSAGDMAVGDWAACLTNTSVTRLGQVISYNTARAKVSLPKLYECGVIVILMAFLCAARHARQACKAVWHVGLFVFGLVACATPLYVQPGFFGIDALPTSVDPIVAMSMCLFMVGRLSWGCIRARDSTRGFVSRHPGLVFCICVLAIFSFNGIVVSRPLRGLGLTSTVLVITCYIVARGLGFLARFLMKGIDLPLLGSWSLFFAYDVSIAIALRRYMMNLTDYSVATAVIVTSGAVELFFNLTYMLVAAHVLNLYFSRDPHSVVIQIDTIFASIVSDMISEQIALHSCLGYALFSDEGMLDIASGQSREASLRNWFLSTCVESIVDGVCVWLIVIILPGSFGRVVSTAWRSPVMLVFTLCSTMHPHLIGLHSLLDPGRFTCSPGVES